MIVIVFLLGALLVAVFSCMMVLADIRDRVREIQHSVYRRVKEGR